MRTTVEFALWCLRGLPAMVAALIVGGVVLGVAVLVLWQHER